MKYFHPSSIPVAVVETSLAEIEKFLAKAKESPADEVLRSAFGFAYELKNILVCGKTDDKP